MDSDQVTIIKVDAVSKDFKLPHEKTSTLKSALINGWRKSKTYELQEALKNINFEVKAGEFFGIVGRNGSGKSTLLKLLAGIYTPTKGNIQVNGSLTPFIELGVGFNPELTGRENVFLNGALFGFNRQQMERMYKGIVKFAELDRFMDQKLKNYSSGMQVRLAFSIAVRVQSDILVVDEVLAVGDAAFQQKCFDYFEELKRNNKTVVFVSHDMNAVRRFCTRAILIDQGELKHIGTPREIADKYTVENIEHLSTVSITEGSNSLQHKLHPSIKKQTSNEVVLSFDYDSTGKDDMYVGISLIKDGASVSEITTPLDMELKGSGNVTYSLDTSLLNGGIYEITAVLSKKHNRQLLCVGDIKNTFVVKGDDITRGAALKLKSSWEKNS